MDNYPIKMPPFVNDSNPVKIQIEFRLFGISEVNTKDGIVKILLLIIYA